MDYKEEIFICDNCKQDVKIDVPILNIRQKLVEYELKHWIKPTQEQIEMAERIVEMYLKI